MTTWMRHDRTPGGPDDDFLIPPDGGIGPVISASTNRTRTGWHPLSHGEARSRNALMVVLGLCLGILGAMLGGLFSESIADHGILPRGGIWLGFFAGIFGAIGLVVGVAGPFVAALLTRRPRATWVAEQGVARYTRGFFGPRHEVLRFADATGLEVRRVRQIVNGVYSGTTYEYTWRGKRGILFQIRGIYRDDRPADTHDPVHFGFAAEAAWSAHRGRQLERALREEGVARFACGRDSIGVGQGFLEIGAGGAAERVPLADLESVRMEQGILVLQKRGARPGLFGTGVHRFPIAALTDFAVFVRMLERELAPHPHLRLR